MTRVLVPLDGSPLAMRALDHALDEWPDAELTVLHVIDPIDAVYESEMRGPGGGEAWYEAQQEATEVLFDQARDRAGDAGAGLRTEVAVGAPAREIVRYVDEHDIDHVVIGSHGREGLSRLVLGSVAERVLRRADAAVTVVR
ncbi:universal stress protein [Haloplanus aerogenes]|uniref:Nucleotide-binding universal stress UspA family protein n=1 Tax=Haloplanus aerogenes TaxID=660522 RepID=A0A3M0DHQ1_9EURY|nr:universal stress protein [Haloplanus aerogenes]AZH26212.1 universal stress protein [Haloplanus aerogenes]RMB18336.1 nucleotide-binding universal stress UspA family protein [Haloplanus aerogenes]